MQRWLISHIIMKGKICSRPTLQSHFEGALWFLPGSSLKTTTDSKIWSTLVAVLHQFSRIIGVESLKDIPLLDPLEYHLLRGNLRYEQNVYTWLVIIHGSWLRRKLNMTREFYWKVSVIREFMKLCKGRFDILKYTWTLKFLFCGFFFPSRENLTISINLAHKMRS